MDSRMTISDEVKEDAWLHVDALVRQVLADEHDLDGFHAVERQITSDCERWMQQALAALAAYVIEELAEAWNKTAPDQEKVTPEQLLSDVLYMMDFQRRRRHGT